MTDRADPLRLFLDATILIKAATLPRLPYEILLLAAAGEVQLVTSAEVISAVQGHLFRRFPEAQAVMNRLLKQAGIEIVDNPSVDEVDRNGDLCRDQSDVSVALAAIQSGADYLLTNDKDLTVVDATTLRLRSQISVITPLALVRYVLGWSEERIEAVIHRNWHELPDE